MGDAARQVVMRGAVEHAVRLLAPAGPGSAPSLAAFKGSRLPLWKELGCLRSTFGNFSPKANTLVRRLNRGVYRVCNRPQNTAPMDHRGPVVRTVGMAQTFLTPSEVDQLVADYEAGSGVQELAEKYGIHRATVFAHLQRREVPRRRPGLKEQEQAEAVRLSRGGMSMRAIGRRMGVDRKAVRVALVEAGVITDVQLAAV
ncbi:hypothetical protein B6N38_05940 [Cutibacterium avidum]|nr:hypothetical protein PALO_02770 [Cutibacterium avidum 44067]PGX68373.1 hypothetical protein B6N39_07945 [Cutibacterium avidum]PGX70539.1 hypothetical protein B6N38_05940 [Cutibacterium avidum]